MIVSIAYHKSMARIHTLVVAAVVMFVAVQHDIHRMMVNEIHFYVARKEIKQIMIESKINCITIV